MRSCVAGTQLREATIRHVIGVGLVSARGQPAGGRVEYKTRLRCWLLPYVLGRSPDHVVT